MSLQGSIDLCVNASPRSLCVFDARHADESAKSNNPFENSTSSVENSMAIVSGTERGSLHFRTYQNPRRGSAVGGLSAAAMGASGGSVTTSSLSGTSAGKPQTPLGLGTSGRSAAASIPRSYLPVDLTSLPGTVVACVLLAGSSSATGAAAKNTSGSHPYFLLLLDDNRGSSVSNPGQYASVVVTLTGGSFHVCSSSRLPKRMSCATYHPVTGLVFGAGRSIKSAGPELWQEEVVVIKKRTTSRQHPRWKPLMFASVPAPGLRGGQDAICLTAEGRVAVIAVGNSFYAVAGQEVDERHQEQQQLTAKMQSTDSVVKVLSFSQSSQVHPVIILDLIDSTMDADWSSLFLANGRECAVVDLYYGPPSAPNISCSKPRNGAVSLPSPILAAAASTSWVVILPSDGMVSLRSPSCLAVALRTVEVGQRPNDFFVLRTLQDETQPAPWIVALAYSGECRLLQCQRDTAQDLADRLMRLAIDAFGANGFPRSELAEAVSASFTATSYVGPEPLTSARNLLVQYLSAVLELADFEGGGNPGWPTELAPGDSHHGTFKDGDQKDSFSGRGATPTMFSAASPAHLMTSSAILCLACSQLSPPSSGLASRTAKRCATKLGIIFRQDVPESAAQVCEMVAERLLREVSSNFSLTRSSTSAPISQLQRGTQAVATDFVEASIWLLRSAGQHERAIEVAHERLMQHGQLDGESSSSRRGGWSRIKFESYIATHLSEIWSSGKEEGFSLVLGSPATYRLLENNPRMGLSVFTANHPQNEMQWKTMLSRDDPLAKPTFVYNVLKLLKSINPVLPYDGESKATTSHEVDDILPLESGRALSVAFLESAIGMMTDRPTNSTDFDSLSDASMEHVANFHDELAFLLLEGVIAECRDDNAQVEDTELGKIYRAKLRQLLKWPLAKVRPERFMEALPSSFLQEKALILGRMDRHEDALRILYRDLNSIELALEYCDDRHERQKSQQNKRSSQPHWKGGTDISDMSFPVDDNAYLPLVRVALDSEDTDRGITAAIQVLALRRGAIDRAAALRLLPSGVPVSAVARPFLIPALVDSDSQVRRLTVMSSLLRARYLRLQDELTVAQLKAQSNLHIVPQLRNIDLGDVLHSTKAFRVRTSTQASSTMPDLMVMKHFFSRHLVIQAIVTNTTGSTANSSDFGISSGTTSSNKVGRVLTDIAFVVAESSEEAIQPMLQVPIKVLPLQLTGSAWCVLDADPSHMDGSTAQLTCELRYTVQPLDGVGNRNASGIMRSSAANLGRTFVEELQDIEVHASHFT